MDLNQLRSFVAVAQFGHMTRAAESLHLSQPALSGHIKALEEQFGVLLFERSSSGMTLTPSGRRLLAGATEIIGAVQQLKNLAQELRGELTGSLKLGTVLEPSLLRVGELTVAMRERYPQVGLELHQAMSSDALAGVRDGSLDASFYFGSTPDAELAALALRDIVYRVAIPLAWADELRDAPWESLAERPWIVAPAPSSHRQLVMQLFQPPAPPPAQIIEADSESVINNLVESGAGVSLVRDEVAAQSVAAGHGAIWPGRQVSTTLWLVYPVARESDPLVAALAECLRAVWSQPV